VKKEKCDSRVRLSKEVQHAQYSEPRSPIKESVMNLNSHF